MKIFAGIDLGSTTTKAVLLDERGEILGRGITNSRSNYDLAASIAKEEARVSARFTLLDRELSGDPALAEIAAAFRASLQQRLRKQQHLRDLRRLRAACLAESAAERVASISGALGERVTSMLDAMEDEVKRPRLPMSGSAPAKQTSEFFRDRAASEFSRLAERFAGGAVRFDDLIGIFDKAILVVENTPPEEALEEDLRVVVSEAATTVPSALRPRCQAALERALEVPFDERGTIGTGYGRQRLPFPKEAIRSEILCHGLGAHHQFPGTRTVLDIGGQDTKAIQVDERGIVTSFQMNDRCAAGCGRYLGYIADEMSLGVHELGPIALESTRRVKITSTCTVFAGAELRDRLTLGQRREDILAGLHRAIVLRAMSLLARSGGVHDEFTFTGGVANNAAAVQALTQLVQENYGERTLNISASSIYTGALGAALFCLRADGAEQAAA